eukprot:4077692-Pleurochrysis_carterae.AAC.2
MAVSSTSAESPDDQHNYSAAAVTFSAAPLPSGSPVFPFQPNFLVLSHCSRRRKRASAYMRTHAHQQPHLQRRTLALAQNRRTSVDERYAITPARIGHFLLIV